MSFTGRPSSSSSSRDAATRPSQLQQQQQQQDFPSGSSGQPRRSSRTPVPNSRYASRDYDTFFRVPEAPPPAATATPLAGRFQRPRVLGQESLPSSSSQAGANPVVRLPRDDVGGGSSRERAGAAAAGAAVNRPENRSRYEERGQTRSGARFAARNLPYFSSIRQLLSHHQRLLEPGPVVSTRYVHVGKGSLLQTCIRFRSDHSDIRGALSRILTELLQELNTENEGLEISVTFNAVLSNRDSTSFSLFFGQSYGPDSPHSRLGLSERPVVVRNLLHVRRVPTEFNLEDLVRRFSAAFDSSDLVVAKILNVVYLVHQYRDRSSLGRFGRRRRRQE